MADGASAESGAYTGRNTSVVAVWSKPLNMPPLVTRRSLVGFFATTASLSPSVHSLTASSWLTFAGKFPRRNILKPGLSNLETRRDLRDSASFEAEHKLAHQSGVSLLKANQNLSFYLSVLAKIALYIAPRI